MATFGCNMLDEPSQVDGFAELCGLLRHKPFECVGEIEESAAVMAHLAGMADMAGLRCGIVVGAAAAARRFRFVVRHARTASGAAAISGDARCMWLSCAGGVSRSGDTPVKAVLRCVSCKSAIRH